MLSIELVILVWDIHAKYRFCTTMERTLLQRTWPLFRQGKRKEEEKEWA
jgi:hypothetical protein